MRRGHGLAVRLRVDDVDIDAIDRLIAAGGLVEGLGRALGRTLAMNDLFGPKRFGKMFPDAAPFRPPDDALVNLGLAMRDFQPEDPALNNSSIPAGFTYLGQFIDHDITFDQTEGFPEINDPDEIEQARTPNIDLDSVYGLGPVRQPELYDRTFSPGRARLKIGTTSPIPSSGGNGQPDVPVSLPNDLPRRADKEAIIGDPRNDENTVVAQVHLAFLKFHNRVMDSLPQRDDDRSAKFTQAEEDRKGTSFHRARRLVRWHYQWIVLNDFLPRLVDAGVLNDIRTNGRKFYRFDRDPFDGTPYMPLEFSAAAYRLGHSMVRETYNFNRVFADKAVEPNAIVPATLALLFTFTGGGGFLAPHTTLPSNWIIDHRRFFEVGDPKLLNFTRKLDTKLIPQLHELPGMPEGEPKSLAVRNLLRGSRVGLPTGQEVAEIVGATALKPDEVASGDDGSILRDHGFDRTTPLWYYILKEAAVQANGIRLGEVGSRIVGEVFVGLLEGDRHSFLAKDPNWKPTLPSTQQGTFTMVDLLRFVNDINPIG